MQCKSIMAVHKGTALRFTLHGSAVSFAEDQLINMICLRQTFMDCTLILSHKQCLHKPKSEEQFEKYPSPHALHPTRYTPRATPYALHPTRYTLRATPNTSRPKKHRI